MIQHAFLSDKSGGGAYFPTYCLSIDRPTLVRHHPVVTRAQTAAGDEPTPRERRLYLALTIVLFINTALVFGALTFLWFAAPPDLDRVIEALLASARCAPELTGESENSRIRLSPVNGLMMNMCAVDGVASSGIWREYVSSF